MNSYNFEKLSVLICDDSLQIRALVRTCLMAFGVTKITETSSAETAVEALVEATPDLLITDWNLGDSDGLDLVGRIRKSPESPNPYLPIIMLTGHTEVERVIIARDAGVSTFLAKPMSAKSLYKRLVSMVEDKRCFIRNSDFFGPDRRFNKKSDFGGDDRRHADAAA